MIKRDYLQQLIQSFTDTCKTTLENALVKREASGIPATEEAIGELLELDPQTLLSLAPESFVTMVTLGGTGEAISRHVAYALNRLADAYLLQINSDMDESARENLKNVAALRREQAAALLAAFDPTGAGVPEDFAAVDQEISQALKA